MTSPGNRGGELAWVSLPKQMDCGSGMTCWRRLGDWQAARVFERLHRALLDRVGHGSDF